MIKIYLRTSFPTVKYKLVCHWFKGGGKLNKLHDGGNIKPKNPKTYEEAQSDIQDVLIQMFLHYLANKDDYKK